METSSHTIFFAVGCGLGLACRGRHYVGHGARPNSLPTFAKKSLIVCLKKFPLLLRTPVTTGQPVNRSTGKPEKGQVLRLGSGQATIELTVALIVVTVLLLGALKIFLWLNERMVQRQVTYETDPNLGRIAAGSTGSQPVTIASFDHSPEETLVIPGEVIPDESAYPKLNIFK